MKRSLMRLMVFLLLAAAPGQADRGSIPFHAGVEIFEPNQRAMIAWNGSEEILLLSTDLHASQPTQVLEVIPLPEEPKVKKGDVEVFKRAIRMINERQLFSPDWRDGGFTRSRTANAPPAGEVTFHEKIGSHDVSVTKVNDAKGFIEWVEKYLKKRKVKKPEIPAALRATIEEYLKEGFRWFVFDVVALTEKPKTNEAIQYTFATPELFYPLKISRTDKGFTKIELLILTPKLLSRFRGLPGARIELPHDPVPITADELKELNPDMDALLEHRADMKLRLWQVSGMLDSFDCDLWAR